MMNTTVEIPDSPLGKAKSKSAQTGQTLEERVTEAGARSRRA
jgi:hypothetical protein